MRRLVLAIILTITMVFCACGQQKTEQSDVSPQPNETETEEIRWKLVDTRLPDADEALKEVQSEGMEHPEVLFYGISQDSVYRVVEMYSERKNIGVCIQKLPAPYTEWENYPMFWEDSLSGVDCGVETATVRQDGSVYVLVNTHDEDGTACQINWTQEAGFETKRTASGYLDNDFLDYISLSYVDKNNVRYFVSGQKVQYYDEAFSEKQVWIDTGYVWQFTEPMEEEESIYLCGETIDGGFCVWTLKGKEPIFASDDVCMDWTGKVVFADKGTGFLCTPEGVWEFQMDGQKMKHMLAFMEQGYSVERVCGSSVNKDGNLLMLAEIEKEYLLLEMTEDEGWQNKTELELAVVWDSPFLQKTVGDFNRQSDEYYIVLRTCGEDEDGNDYRTRIQMEVSSGSGPAIIGDDVLDVGTAAQKDMLWDLTEEFAEDKQSMLENVRGYGEVDGRTFAIPWCCYVDTFVVSENIVGDKESWTPEEFMEYVRNSGAEKAVSRMGGAELFWYLIGRGKLIDWESGVSRLNGEEAVLLLEFAGRYGGEDTVEDANKRIAEGRTLVMREPYINTVYPGAHTTEALFQGKEVYIGYPIDNPLWENGNRLNCCAFAVNQACETPDGAVAFIRYLLSEECQNRIAEDACRTSSVGFPVNEVALENTFLYAKEHRGMEDYTEGATVGSMGFDFVQEPVSAEGLEKLKKVLLDARLETVYTSEVENIVFEEAPAYFSGSRTAQEVCDVIQNRVQLYLDEMK